MSKKYERYYFIYIFWLLIFVIFTNQHYNFDEIVNINQLDSVSYMAIANYSPNYSSEILPYHHAQRVFFPYFVGLIANVLNFDIFYSFKVFTFISLFLIIYIHYLTIKKLKTDFFFSIISISLLILNPYIFRYFIAVPTMINDAVFILSIYLFLFSLVSNNNYVILSIFLGLVTRQNGIFLFIANLIDLFFRKKYKFFKTKNFIVSLLIIIIALSTSNYYASKVSIEGFDYEHVYGTFDWFINNGSFLDFVKWLLLPFYSFLPIILIFFIYRKLKNFKKNDLKNHIILLFIFISIVGLPLLSGPDLASRNIIRLTTLAFPIFLVWISWFTDVKKEKYNNKLFIVIIVALHIWSLHPTYSNISLFVSIKNYLL